MPRIYTCCRCAYHTPDLSRFRRHCNRKFICPAKIADVSPGFDEVVARVVPRTNFECLHCHKHFSSKDTLKKHLHNPRTKCPSRPPPSDSPGALHMDGSHLAPFGSDNLDERNLDDDFKKKLVNDPLDAFDRLTEAVYFSPDHPEFHNIYVPNTNKNVAHIWDGKRWRIQSKQLIAHRLVCNVVKYMLPLLEEEVRTNPTKDPRIHGVFMDVCCGIPSVGMFKCMRDMLWQRILSSQGIMRDRARRLNKALRHQEASASMAVLCAPTL